MPKWTDYTIKTTVADNDEVMVLDTAGKANKRLSLSTLPDWVLGKIADKVFEKLQTNDKTILGAINELNSNRLFDIHRNYSWKTSHSIDVSKASTLLIIAFGGSNGDQSIVLPLTKTGTDTWLYNAEYLATTNFAISCKSNVLTVTNTATFLCFLVKVV